MLSMHTSGRSAAILVESYGDEPVRRWTKESLAFFREPPKGFSDVPLVSPRGAVFVARAEGISQMHTLLKENPGVVHSLSRADAQARVPILRADLFAEFAEEPNAVDIDVGALFEGLRENGRARRDRDGHGGRRSWASRTARASGAPRPGDSRFYAPVLINAAGAWAGRIGLMAGLGDRGLTPKRRTAIVFAAPDGVNVSALPFVNDVAGEFYFKPEAGLLLASPADETPSEPCDGAARGNRCRNHRLSHRGSDDPHGTEHSAALGRPSDLYPRWGAVLCVR
ncbi:MAG: FAD-binding oxidoreductase [Rhizomicrobium sp.]